MLYISRRISNNAFGVVDTDDGSEDIMSRKEIREAVIKLGIKIEGVSIYKEADRNVYNIRSIKPYQPTDSVSRQQVKAKVLRGVDIKKHGDVITGISVTGINGQVPVVRLSDYGTEFEKYVLSGFHIEVGTVFILDDSLKITAATFKDWHGRLQMDLREVSDMKIVNAIYSDFVCQPYIGVRGIHQYYIDKPERKGYAEALWILANGHKNNGSKSDVPNIIAAFGPDVQDLVTQQFSKEFFTIATKSQLRENEHYNAAALARQAVQTIYVLRDGGVAKSNNFSVWRSSGRTYEMLELLSYCSTLNTHAVIRFMNYMHYFKSSEEMQAAFVDFCQRSFIFLDRLCSAIRSRL